MAISNKNKIKCNIFLYTDSKESHIYFHLQKNLKTEVFYLANIMDSLFLYLFKKNLKKIHHTNASALLTFKGQKIFSSFGNKPFFEISFNIFINIWS